MAGNAESTGMRQGQDDTETPWPALDNTSLESQSLAQELLEACTDEPRKVRDVIADALAATGWTKTDDGYKHATLKGRTPTATAHATMLNLVRKGALVKPERGMVKLGPKAKS